jgi:hypothetical protein
MCDYLKESSKNLYSSEVRFLVSDVLKIPSLVELFLEYRGTII